MAPGWGNKKGFVFLELDGFLSPKCLSEELAASRGRSLENLEARVGRGICRGSALAVMNTMDQTCPCFYL